MNMPANGAPLWAKVVPALAAARDDGFRRGSLNDDDAAGEDASRPSPTPPAGRDEARMFWESIGMKPGDDWKNEAKSRPGGKRGGDDG